MPRLLLEGGATHERPDLIPPRRVLVPQNKCLLIQCEEGEVSPLQQGPTVVQPSTDCVIYRNSTALNRDRILDRTPTPLLGCVIRVQSRMQISSTIRLRDRQEAGEAPERKHFRMATMPMWPERLLLDLAKRPRAALRGTCFTTRDCRSNGSRL